MTRNELITKLEQVMAQKYPNSKDNNNNIRQAINALYANQRYSAAQYLELEGLENLAGECVDLGNLSIHNF